MGKSQRITSTTAPTTGKAVHFNVFYLSVRSPPTVHACGVMASCGHGPAGH